MGMYDNVDLDIKCPQCGNTDCVELQTKDVHNALSLVKPEDTQNFYGTCYKCKVWVDFTRLCDEFIASVESRVNLDDRYWKFGDYWYRCIVRYTVRPDGSIR